VTSRRSPLPAVAGCAAGGLLVLLTSGRQWAHTTVHAVTGSGATSLSVSGHDVEPSLSALGIALLALAVAILASNGLMRRVVGAVVALVAASAVGVGVAGRAHVSSALENGEVGAKGIAVHAAANGWWVVAVLGGLMALAAGLLTVVRSGSWGGMGSKYDAPAAPKPARDPAAVAWDALDRGEDPTT
jgi:uncharacterized membrane protein (TIGR02234 family)